MIGLAGFLVFEWKIRVGEVGVWQHFRESWFHSVSARTAGYSLFDLGQLSRESILLMIILMVIGGAPASTAGGIKVTVAAVAVAVAWGVAMGRNNIELFKRRLTTPIIARAIGAATLFFCFGVFGIAVLTALQDVGAVTGIFEVVSALGTVGLTLGLTSQLTVGGKILIIFLMFMGRVGLLSLVYGMVFTHRKHVFEKKHPPAKILLS